MELSDSLIRFSCLLIGLAAGAYLLRSLTRQHAAKRWPTTTGEILESTLEENADGWHPQVRYTYSVQGKSYVGDQLYLYASNERAEPSAREYLVPFPTGKTVAVYYNPEKPQEAVLDTRVPVWRPIFWALFAMLFLAFSAVV